MFSVYAGFRLLKAKRNAPIKIGAMERMMGIERNFNGLLLVKTQYTVFLILMCQIIIQNFCGFFAPCMRNFCINILCCTCVGMTEQILCVLDVNARFMQKRRVAVTELMRGQIKPRFLLPMCPCFVKEMLTHEIGR